MRATPTIAYRIPKTFLPKDWHRRRKDDAQCTSDRDDPLESMPGNDVTHITPHTLETVPTSASTIDRPATTASPLHHAYPPDVERNAPFSAEPRPSTAQRVWKVVRSVTGGIYRGPILLCIPYLFKGTIERLEAAYNARQNDRGAELTRTSERVLGDLSAKYTMVGACCAVPLLGVVGSFFQVVSLPQDPLSFTFTVLVLVFSMCAMILSGYFCVLLGTVKQEDGSAAPLWVRSVLNAHRECILPADVILAYPISLLIWTVLFFFCLILAFVWTPSGTQPPSSTLSTSLAGPDIEALLTTRQTPLAVASATPSQAPLTLGLIPMALTIVLVLVVAHTLLVAVCFYQFGHESPTPHSDPLCSATAAPTMHAETTTVSDGSNHSVVGASTEDADVAHNHTSATPTSSGSVP